MFPDKKSMKNTAIVKLGVIEIYFPRANKKKLKHKQQQKTIKLNVIIKKP